PRLLALALVFAAGAAHAVPREIEASDEDRGATVTLTLLDKAIIGDSRSFCRVRFVLVNEHRDMTEGDTVELEVTEDDFVGNDNLWQMNFSVTAAEAAAGRVDRTFDCSGPFGEDVNAALDIFARANVDRDTCGFTCNDADPSTANLSVESVEDDGDEEDDASGAAKQLPLGRAADRIARDQDWKSISFLDPSNVRLELLHRTAAGRLDLTLYDVDGDVVAQGDAQPGATVVQAGPLPAGEYRARVQPRDGADFNFYDLELRVEAGGCAPGAIEQQACGNCGMRSRTCQPDARWGDFGACEGEGPCAPGAVRGGGCGNCGTQMQTCDAMCQWSDGECRNEGECAPDAVDAEACEGDGTRRRTCDDQCAWGPFGACEAAGECTEGEQQDCYDGPDETNGVGACRRGTQTCAGGQWGACEGQTLPAAEVCDDQIDNDCDGATDDDDPACGAEAAVGDACSGDADCGEGLTCLGPPDQPPFRGGYCTQPDCDVACPGDAICGTAFGLRTCLRACDADADCRPGQVCADVEANATACLPR
ncbi:MAG: hypothetical protein KC583_18395, partial [Myxococcales bacterium]|nr:hypothetical protein [Myxococcales bacterium]